MKKFFGILIGLAVLSSCCCPDSNQTIKPASVTTNTGQTYPVKKFTYEGHDYLMFTSSQQMAVVHNPKCHCRHTYN